MQIGIHLTSSLLQMSLVKRTGKGVVIENKSFTQPNVKPLYIKNLRDDVATVLGGESVLVRACSFPIPNGRHAEEAIRFQAEGTSHLNPEEVLTVPLLQKEGALLFTVEKRALAKHLAEMKKLGIDPDAVTAAPSALCAFIRWKFPKGNAFAIDIGLDETVCIFVENGRLKKARTISIGVKNLMDAFFEDRKKVLLKTEVEAAAKQCNLLQLKGAPRLTSALDELRLEIAKTAYSFFQEEKKTVIFTGRGDTFFHLHEYLLCKASIDVPLEEQKFAIAIGAALEQTEAGALQLRKADFFPMKNWKKMGRHAVSLLASSTVLSLTILALTIFVVKERQERMKEAFSINGSVEEWIYSVEKNKKEYPYLLQAPNCTQVLAWISSHPLKKELDIRDIRYQLVSLPTIDAPKEPYLAKVEIEFCAPSNLHARKFHEALMKETHFIDQKKEIGWENINDGYRISFFLKNGVTSAL